MRDLHHLTTRAAHGDHAALEHFVRTVQPDTWRYLRSLTGPDNADDLTQETLIRVVINLRRWTHGSPLTWTLGIARNVAREHERSSERRRRLTPATRLNELSHPDHAEHLTTRHLVDALHPDQREAFMLTQQLGLSYAEAATVIGCPVGTVRSRLARARDALAPLISGANGIDNQRAG